MEDNLATWDDAFREYARNAGEDCPEDPWIMTPWDVWMPNPNFRGDISKERHPEDHDW
jgi:hypothetical protein